MTQNEMTSGDPYGGTLRECVIAPADFNRADESYGYDNGRYGGQDGPEVDEWEGTYFDRDNYGKGANPYSPSTDIKDVALVYSIILAPIVGTMELGALATAGVGVGFNSLSQYIANGGNAGDINVVEAGMSGIPAIGKIPYLSKLAPTLIGETVSWTPNSSWELPKSPAKWGAQVFGGVVSLGFGTVTDKYLAGEKGGKIVGDYFKFWVETVSNAAPNAVK